MKSYALPPLLVYAATAGLVLAITRSVAFAAGSALGPFAGGYARDWQTCCQENSWSLAPYAFGGVALAIAVRVLLRQPSRLQRALGSSSWWAGWLVWFLCALISYGHALE